MSRLRGTPRNELEMAEENDVNILGVYSFALLDQHFTLV